jgi:hypothetical protein
VSKQPDEVMSSRVLPVMLTAVNVSSL